MQDQDFQKRGSGSARSIKDIKETAGEALAKASDMARDTGAKAKDAASDAASAVSEQVKEVLDRQIGDSWNVVSKFAGSAKRTADELQQSSPLVAGLVRDFASKVEDYSGEMQDQTVEQLMRTAADFTRRQPAVIFGLTALAGFLVFRTLKSAQETSAPSLQPEQGESSSRSQQRQPGTYYG